MRAARAAVRHDVQIVTPIAKEVLMVRMVIRVVLQLVGNALGLLIATALLDDMDMTASGFVVAVLIFTAVAILAQPLIMKVALKNAEALQGSTALIATFVALLLTVWITDSLSIDGVSTWLLATVIVWIVTLLAGIILPMIFLKKAIDERA
jgi:putative membrane protein